ncbi:hypothetical protein FACS1894186_1730 [Alphaproteobacteria bacterium]|nr:hypothetical protein FACS1894186_1730 [Alphaproteobacteria bacterium]
MGDIADISSPDEDCELDSDPDCNWDEEDEEPADPNDCLTPQFLAWLRELWNPTPRPAPQAAAGEEPTPTSD